MCTVYGIEPRGVSTQPTGARRGGEGGQGRMTSGGAHTRWLFPAPRTCPVTMLMLYHACGMPTSATRTRTRCCWIRRRTLARAARHGPAHSAWQRPRT